MPTPLSAHQGGRIVAEYADREHYIPLRVCDLVELLCQESTLSHEAQAQFRGVARRLSCVFHHEYHDSLEKLKEAYSPFDPDQDIQLLRQWSPEERTAKLDELFSEFDRLLSKANYRRLTKDSLEAAFSQVSAWGINMEVDFNQFDKLEVYARGDSKGKRVYKSWKTWWKERWLDVELLQRIVIIVKLKKTKKTIEAHADTDDVYMKIFKDIPKADLEMLLPGAKVRFSTVDRSKIGFPLLTGGLLMAWNIFKVSILGLLGFAATGPAGGTMMIWGMTAGALGYGYRSYYSYNFTKNQYTLQLTRSLYYQNLDNNGGVLFRLIDAAEEQESREALLGYFFLWQSAGAEGWTAEQLDDHVEEYLEKTAKVKVDFEIGDALEKLLRLGLVEELAEKRYRAFPITEVLGKLDQQWQACLK